MRVTVLGCGTSSGVPRVPENWGYCDPSNPKNRRRRPAILIESETTTVVVDTGPDFREQMLDAGVQHLDGVVYTHDHADHTHGIDDLRGFYRTARREIPCYADAVTLNRLQRRFDYIFAARQGYPAMAAGHIIDGAFTIGDLTFQPFEQHHGAITSLGFRIGDFAYSTDAHDLPETSFAALSGVRTWIVDAVQEMPHPSHAHVDRTLDWIARVKPDRAYLTHMAQWLDYDALMERLPAGVAPAFDGLVLEV